MAATGDDRRVVVITGATRGIGRAAAERFAELGHVVCGCGRSLEAVENLRCRLPEPHRFDVVDVAEHEDVARWAEAVIASHGAPDLVLSNAGLINRPAPLWKVPPDELRAVIEVNLLGVAWMMHAFLPPMARRGSGVIVNVSSGWGRVTSPEVAPYCASKFGLEGLTRAVADEVPPGVAVVAVSPGVVGTEMLRTAWGAAVPVSPTPVEWAHAAVPKLLALGPRDNGRSVSIP
jgi:NAD(P)-dependent dehydrogenase (short-subunit alcohol dehydrogenase family)